MNIESSEIRVRGKHVRVPSTCIGNRTIIATGRWPKIARVLDEQVVQGEIVSNPEMFISQLKETGLKADILTFSQRLPDITPKYKYQFEWDNVAAIPITSFSDWLKNRVEHDVRAAVKKATRLGVVIKQAEFEDEFVKAIGDIYNESPVRQGKAFWHYQKDFDMLKRENSTYLDRSTFIGAYYEDKLIGFLKLIYLDSTEAVVIHLISQMKHANRKPTNALIAKAVELCEQKGISYLTYGKYVYTDPSSSLTEFKRRNGFEKTLLPRYYIPLTTMGKIALKLNLHHQPADWIPQPVLSQFRKMRRRWYNRKLQSVTKAL